MKVKDFMKVVNHGNEWDHTEICFYDVSGMTEYTYTYYDRDAEEWKRPRPYGGQTYPPVSEFYNYNVVSIKGQCGNGFSLRITPPRNKR